MNIEKKLLSELLFFGNEITDDMYTEDYKEPIIEAYTAYSEGDLTGDFGSIVKFRKFLGLEHYTIRPDPRTMHNLEDEVHKLHYIHEHRRAYKYVISIMLKDLRKCKSSTVRGILKGAIKAIGSRGDLKRSLLKQEIYLGDQFNSSDLVNAIYYYGTLSGLIDYYNRDEGLYAENIKG